MIATIENDVPLKDGRRMTVKVIEPPQRDYAEGLCHFLEHKGGNTFRGIKQRLYGRYTDYCIDRFFVGEIRGQIVGQAWYGLPRGGTGVGNFGHVYTEPDHRGKGIATQLVRALVDDFSPGDGKCLLCNAGRNSAGIYRRFGFEIIRDGAQSGPAALIRKTVADTFRELDEWYFEGGLSVRVRDGNIRDRHDCDRMLDFSRGANELKRRWHRVFIASQVPTFMDALFCVEDGKGIVTVIESAKGSILGHAFVLSLGSEFEGGLKALEFAIHPNYLREAARFVGETAAAARAAGIAEMYAFAASCDEEKVRALEGAGFGAEYRFDGGFRIDGLRRDIVVLRLGKGGPSCG